MKALERGRFYTSEFWRTFWHEDTWEKALVSVGALVRMDSLCESPIEAALGAALVPLISGPMRLVPQYDFLRYRIDFAILIPEEKKPVLFIECDGAKFHSTEKQVKNDRAKDSAAAAAGVFLRRISGSDIHRDLKNCCALVVRDIQWDLAHRRRG